MAVKMYDCDFGDCFMIEKEHVEGGVPLFVDFGVHSRSKALHPPTKRYDAIIGDMPSNMDLLITHYHDDHYSGIMHMYRKGGCKRFRKVYIPDVWEKTQKYLLIKMLILSTIYDGSTKSQVNIADFLKTICYSEVHLVKRGDSISDNFVALWPVKRDIRKKVSPISLECLSREDRDTLEDCAKILYDAVRQIVDRNNEADKSNNGIVMQMLDECSQRIQNININNISKELTTKLNKFGNQISIVFRNKRYRSSGRNMLFTGDIDNTTLNKLCKCKGYPKMLRDISIIKVPHHGTDSYYFDFNSLITKSGDGILLIPNGSIPKWEISRYYLSLGTINYSIIVSNINGFGSRTTTLPANIYSIAPDLFIEI